MKETIKNDDGSDTKLNLETLEGQIEVSKLWSEGRKSLEELLFYCMQNGIKTLGCCAGHYEDGIDPEHGGYIGFNLEDNKTRETIYKLMEREMSKSQGTTVLVTRFKSNYEKIDLKGIHIHSEIGREDETFSRLIKDLQEILQQKESSQPTEPKTQKILDFFNIECKNNVDFQMYYRSKQDELGSILKINGVVKESFEGLRFEDASSKIEDIKESMSKIRIKDLIKSLRERGIKKSDIEESDSIIKTDDNKTKDNNKNIMFVE